VLLSINVIKTLTEAHPVPSSHQHTDRHLRPTQPTHRAHLLVELPLRRNRRQPLVAAAHLRHQPIELGRELVDALEQRHVLGQVLLLVQLLEVEAPLDCGPQPRLQQRGGGGEGGAREPRERRVLGGEGARARLALEVGRVEQVGEEVEVVGVGREQRGGEHL